MVVNHVKSTDQVRRLVFCLFLTCFITSVIGILQIPEGVRVSAPFEGDSGEPNTLGGYLLFTGAIAVGIVIKTKNHRLKNSLIVLSIVIIPPLLFTQSRSSYLGLIPVSLILGLFTKRKIVVVGLLILIFLLSPLFLPSQVKDRILYTFTQRVQAGQISIGSARLDTSTSARIASLKEILQDWPKHPFIGYGVTGYKFADAQYPRVLIETGLLGLLAFLFVLYALFKLTIRHLKNVKSAEFKGLTIGFLAGFVGLLFHGLGSNTFIIVRIMEPFWFFAGIIAVLPAIEQQHQEQPETKSIPVRRKLAAVR
jgi:O-antigen ligase